MIIYAYTIKIYPNPAIQIYVHTIQSSRMHVYTYVCMCVSVRAIHPRNSTYSIMYAARVGWCWLERGLHKGYTRTQTQTHALTLSHSFSIYLHNTINIPYPIF